MPRRIILLIALVALGLLGVTVAPWTLSDEAFARSVAQQLRRGYGLDLSVRGESTIALLPVPRLKFENVSLATSDRSVQAEGGTLRGELSLWALLRGRVEFSRASLSGSQIAVAEQASMNADWAKLLSLLGGDAAKGAHLRRIVLNGSSVRWSAGPVGSAENVTVIVNWPDPDEDVRVTAWGDWRGETVQLADAVFDPTLLAAGQASPITLNLAAAGASLKATGELHLGADPRLSGTGVIEARSARDFSRWSGLDLPFGSLMRKVSIEGEFTADRRRLTWPSVAVRLGPDRLDGTLAVRFSGNRPALTGTLAADDLDLSEFVLPFTQARTASGLWSGDDVRLERATGGDLDLRLSANNARIGGLRVGDMAASVLVRPGRIEASLARASLRNGTLKGRLALASGLGSTDLKAQASFDQVDLAAVLADLGHSRWITGEARGQFTLDASGETVMDLVRQSHGRASVVVKEGELIGIGLDDVLRRVEKQPLSASLDWRGGRTPFHQASVSMNVGAGIGEIVEGALETPTMRTALNGRVSLVDRSLALRARVGAAEAAVQSSPLIEFDLKGGWDDVLIVPDAKALIERSGAAKRLLGLDRLPAATRDASALPPAATAQ